MSKRKGGWYEQYLRDLPGEEGRFWRSIYGRDDAEFADIVEHDKRRRPGVFNRKLNNRPSYLKVVRPSGKKDD